MLFALALLSCSSLPELLDDGEEIGTVTPPPSPGSLAIATAPDKSPFRRASVLESPLPGGEPIVRDCFGGIASEGRNSALGPTGGLGMRGAGSGGGAVAAPPPAVSAPSVTVADRRPAPTPSAAPMPSPKPTAAARPASPMDGGGGFVGGQAAPEAESAPVQTSVPAGVPPHTDAITVLQDPAGKGRAKDDANLAKSEPDVRRQEAKPTPDVDSVIQVQEEKLAVKTSTMDWGANVYLSNDDSMSLASAQRVLYALSHQAPLKTSEVRPHELLNYFSFDSVAPVQDRLFGVLGAAEQAGDTLTVSLAVRGANPDRQPLDMTVLLDRSGSMSAEGRMEYTRRGLTLLSENLQRGDRLDLVLFDTDVCTPLENFVVGRDSPELLTTVIRQLEPRGSTNLDAGLKEAYRIQTSRDAATTHGRNRRVLLVTDAMLNTGNVNEAVVAQVGTAFDQHGVRLSGVGVGREFNDKMLDMLTERGKGAYVYLGSEAVVERVFGPGFDSLVRTIAHDVHFSLDLPPSLAMERFYGEEASTTKSDVQSIHYYAGTTQLFLQDLAIKDGRVVREDPITLRIEYRDAISGEPAVQELRTTVGALIDGDPHNLRKGMALMKFSDVVMAHAMRADPCGAPLGAYREAIAPLHDDAEIGFTNGLVGGLCRVNLATVVAKGVAVKLKVDSDQPVSEVVLQCDGRTHLESMSAADTIATFANVSPGACTVELRGQMPMRAAVEVSEVGGDLRCMVRGGRVTCG